MFKEYTNYDALGLAELIRKKEVSASEVLAAALHKVAELNPSLNAVIHQFGDRAKKQIETGLPDGPFTGVPFLLKDLTAVFEGERMTMGSRGINWIPTYDSVHVERIKASGATIFGKTNTPELGLIVTTEPLAHGPTHNPHKQGYSTGGSSGGSACAVASRMVPMAGGGDGGGSIRFPSAWCGVFGLKPSRGLNPLQPDYSEGWSGAIADHVLTRTVRDSAAMLDQTAGYASGGPYRVDKDERGYFNASQKDPKPLRIGLSQNPLVDGTDLHPEVIASLEKTVKRLQDLGHIVEAAEPEIDTNRFWKDFIQVVACHTTHAYDKLKEKFGNEAVAKLELSTKNSAILGRAVRADQFIEALDGWRLAQMAMGKYLTKYDLMLCPTVPIPALKHGVLPPSSFEKRLLKVNQLTSIFGSAKLAWKSSLLEQMVKPLLSKMCFTILGNVTGLPCMSVPLDLSSEGLPIGMQFVGRMGDEVTLFSLAAQLERSGFFTCSKK